jgi:phosphate transport system substrate-binding protein
MKKIFKSIATFATVAITSAIMAGPAAAGDIVLDGSTTVGPIAKAFAEYYMKQNKGVNVTVSESGSGNGAKSLINSTCDIANMSRFMKDKEFKAAVDGGVFPVAHAVALDGLPILVHPSNPVNNLTVDQVRDIYMGKIKNWKELGGPNMEIVFVSRDTNSGTYETFEKLVMRKEKINEKAEYVGSNGAARQRVQSTPAAIGYAGLGFVDDTVKALSVNGIKPSSATVRTGTYPIARALFMFTNGFPKLGTHVYNFINLSKTEAGDNLIKETGFIPMTEY